MKRCFSTCFKRCKKKKIPEVYVLLLENNKFYVGESMNKGKRIQSHRKGHGSAWTRQNKMVNSIPPITNKQESFWELKETLERFRLHGIDNVRGSMFTSTYPLKQNDKIMAAQLYCELKGLCRKCGGEGHFIGNCKTTEMAEWVQNFGGKLNFDVDTTRKCTKCSKDISNNPSYFKYCTECYRSRP